MMTDASCHSPFSVSIFVTFVICLHDFYDFRATLHRCNLRSNQFDSYDSDREEADDATSNFQVDTSITWDWDPQTADEDAGSSFRRRDETDECANDDNDFPHFEFDMLPDFP